jgi:hypothetical protein
VKVLQGEGMNNFWLEEAPSEEMASEWEEEPEDLDQEEE